MKQVRPKRYSAYMPGKLTDLKKLAEGVVIPIRTIKSAYDLTTCQYRKKITT